MDLEALANIGEFISGIVVILSLVYLAVQIRQNTESQRTENYARALDRLAAMQAKMAENAEFSDLFSRGVADPLRLDPGERIRFGWGMYEFFGAIEFMFHAAKSGALPDQVWSRWSHTAAWWLSQEGVREWWAARPAPFTPEFTAFVEATLRDDTRPALDPGRWRDYVLGRGLGSASSGAAKQGDPG